MQHEASLPVEAAMYESGSFASRCSARVVHDVVSNFPDYKKELVKSLGFEGILHLPDIKQVNRRFVLWLMSAVKVESSSLLVGDNIDIKFTKHDVAHVFGIPCTGKSVFGNRLASREDRD